MNGLLIRSALTNHKHSVLSKRNQMQKATYYLILFIENVQKRYIYRNKKYIDYLLPAEERGWGLTGHGTSLGQ